MRIVFSRAASTVAFTLVIALALTVPAWANGGSFFDEEDEHGDNVGPSYFGFVKETNGKLIPDAVITATIKEMNSSVTARTNVMGVYRIPGFAKSIDPKQVDINCSKSGYKQTARVQRPSPPNAPIEVSCTMAKE
jgi:hypothetical protein